MLDASTAGSFAERRNRRPDSPRSAHGSSESSALSNAGFNMTTPPEMRELARRLLSYEADAGKNSEPVESATLRVYDKLRHSLGALAGIAGFQSLASRALALAKSEAPSLNSARVSAEGALQGLGGFQHSNEIDKDQAQEDTVGDGGAILIACLLGLLLVFLGEALTFRLLRVTWPGAAFDDRNSETRREA